MGAYAPFVSVDCIAGRLTGRGRRTAQREDGAATGNRLEGRTGDQDDPGR